MSAQIFLTGATGHVGSGVLLKALQEGYSVRAAVRSLDSADKIRNLPFIKKHNFGDKLTFVEVPDILDPKAYTEAVKGVEYVIHLASPIMHPHFAETNLTETIVNPAIRGTTNILEAASTVSSIKRVVITSSVVANTNIANPKYTANAHTREPVPEYHDLPTAYFASKHAALLASDSFMAEKKPHFDLINVMPAYVIGRKELATSPEDVIAGSNGASLGLLLKGAQPYSVPAATIHLDDVALVHVAALRLPGHENRDFGVTGDFDPNTVFEILKRHFPAAIANGTFKQPAERQQFHHIQWDASETEKVFGIRFRGVEEQVVPVARQYLELQGQA